MTTPDLIADARLSGRLLRAGMIPNLKQEADRLDALADCLEQQDRALRSSVPERWKSCTSPVGAVQSYIAEIEEELERLRAQVAQDSSLTALRDMLRAEVDRLNAARAAPAGMVLVPAEILDRFPEINPSNYDHDDACALNAWGVELVLAASPAAPAQQAGQAPAVAPEDAKDAALWRYVMDWDQPKFAVCRRIGATGTCWEPIKTSGPVEAAMAPQPSVQNKEPTHG